MILQKFLTDILVLKLKKEIWYLRTRMKAHAKEIIVQSYNLVVSDEMLTKWRMKNSDISMSDEKLRAKLLKERIADLVGHTGAKDSYFIYGRGTVRHAIYVSFSVCLLISA